MSEVTPAPEEWRAVVGFEGSYEVSDLGGVRSLDRVIELSDGRRKRLRGRALKPVSDPRGYLQVTLGRRNRRYVHTLVAEAFHGRRPDGMVVLHGPGGSTDNRKVNLSWGTQAQNIADMVRDGTDPNGDRHGCAKLTWEQVDEIRRLIPVSRPPGFRSKEAKHWLRQKDLAAKYGVDQQTISAILTGKKWRPEFRREAS